MEFNDLDNKPKYMQWVVGERRGEVLVFDGVEEEEGEVFIKFKDGSRINETFVAEINKIDLTDKMMAEIESPNNIWRFSEEWVGHEEEKWEISQTTGESVCVQPFVAGRKKVNLIPPKPASRFSNLMTPAQIIANEISSTNPLSIFKQNIPTKPKVNNNDPVYILFNKSKKIDTEISMALTISLPSEHLFNVARDSFEDGEEKALEYIIENIDISLIKEELKKGIKIMYNETITNTTS